MVQNKCIITTIMKLHCKKVKSLDTTLKQPYYLSYHARWQMFTFKVYLEMKAGSGRTISKHAGSTILSYPIPDSPDGTANRNKNKLQTILLLL